MSEARSPAPGEGKRLVRGRQGPGVQTPRFLGLRVGHSGFQARVRQTGAHTCFGRFRPRRIPSLAGPQHPPPSWSPAHSREERPPRPIGTARPEQGRDYEAGGPGEGRLRGDTGVAKGTRARWRRDGLSKEAPPPLLRRPCPRARALPWIGAITRGTGSGLRLGRGGRGRAGGQAVGSPCSSLRSFCLAWCSFSRRDSMVASGWGRGGRTRPAPQTPRSRTHGSAPWGPDHVTAPSRDVGTAPPAPTLSQGWQVVRSWLGRKGIVKSWGRVSSCLYGEFTFW